MKTAYPKEGPRYTWRASRLLAKHLDRTSPYWWEDHAILAVLLRYRDRSTSRCMLQLIRQRRGV